MAGRFGAPAIVLATLLLGAAGTVAAVDAGSAATGDLDSTGSVVDRPADTPGVPVSTVVESTETSPTPTPAESHRSSGIVGPVRHGTATGPPFTPPDVDTTTTRIRVFPNGSATWIVEIRTRITNETDRQDYREFQATFRDDTDRYLGPYRERMVGLVERAENVTGREMTARDFVASTRIQDAPRQWGVVKYRFYWDGFAEARDGAVVVGDVFESGYFLTEGDSLVVETTAGYRIETASPTPDRRDPTVVRWFGPIDFADRRPSVRAIRANDTATPTDASGTTVADTDDTTAEETGRTPTDAATTPGGSETTPTDGEGSSGSATRASGGTPPGIPDGSTPSNDQLVTVLGGLVVLVVGVGGYVFFSRRNGTPDAGASDLGGTGSGGEKPEGGRGTAAPEEATSPAGELVTDEELVIDLLESNGGRMRQADIGDDLDWSASKTSRVLSDMAEEGAIEKLRLGNENIIDRVEDGE